MSSQETQKKSPNLFIIGAMKSGTTSLHNYLNTHPGIFMSELKEPGFFVEEIAWHKGFDWYASLFAGASDELYIGESSTDYTKLPFYKGVPEKIQAFNPDSKFVYIVRNPFERLVSHYWHAVRHLATGGEKKDLYSACMQNIEFISFSLYADQIKPYIDLFGLGQIFITSFEQLIQNPSQCVNEIFHWLGLDGETEEDFNKRWNAKPEKIIGPSGPDFLNRLRYSRTWDKLAPFFPKGLRNRASTMTEGEVDVSTQEKHKDKLRAEVIPRLREQVEEFQALTGKDFSSYWKL